MAVAVHHFVDDAFEHADDFVHFHDDGVKQVGDAVVGGEFHALGVNEQHAEFGGGAFHKEAGHDGVEGDAFARAGSAGDEQVGHFGEVKRDVFAACAFAERYGQAGVGADFFVLRRFHNGAQGDWGGLFVGDFDADLGFAHNGGFKAQVGGSEGER